MVKNRDLLLIWKRRPSEIRGYERAIYTTMDNGDYLRVDYNVGDRRARIYVEVSDENGAPYYSVISQGVINVERNSSGKSARVASRIKERALEISTLPNKDVLALLNGYYGIAFDYEAEEEKRNKRKDEIETTKRKYFRNVETPRKNPYGTQTVVAKNFYKRFSFIDIFDLLVGMALAGFFFWINQYSFVALGVFCVFWGLLLGFFDLVIREREPLFTKVAMFLLIGTMAYFYGYFFL